MEKDEEIATIKSELSQATLHLSELDSQVELRDDEINQLKKQLA